MRNNSQIDNFYSNATLKTNSLDVQLEVLSMSLRPYSRKQKLEQIASLNQGAVYKENSNEQRRNAKL